MFNSKFKVSIINDEIDPDIEKAIKFCISQDINIIDLRSINGVNLLDIEYEELVKVKKLLDVYKMEVGMLTTPLFKWYGEGSITLKDVDSFHLHHFNPSISFDAKKSYIEKAFKIAELLNTKFIRVFSLIREDNLDIRFIEIEKELYKLTLELSLASGINVVLENEPSCNFYSTKHILNIDYSLDNKPFGLLLDIGNIYAADEIFTVKDLQKVKKHVAYIHLKDFCSKTKEYVAFGTGDVPHKELLKYIYQNTESKLNISFEPHLKCNQEFLNLSVSNLRNLLLSFRR